MKAVTVHPPTPGAEISEVDEPTAGPGQVKVAVTECGVCGTDRDIVQGKYGTPPADRSALILGHENLGRVVEVGEGVPGIARGDLVVATVRRGCGACRFCLTNRSDFCETGRFTERGIKGEDGYLAEFYVDRPEYLVSVPPELSGVAVLMEPLSVVVKAFEEGSRVLSRFEPTPGQPRTRPLTALVTGTGAIGMLASLLLTTEGYEVTAIDRHDGSTPSGLLLERIGARHVNVADGLTALGTSRFNLIFEASGSAALDLELPAYLARNGVLALTGIPSVDSAPVPVPAGSLFREMVLANQAFVGSVNANRRFFESGARYLASFGERFPGVTPGLITSRRPLAEIDAVLAEKDPNTIKNVVTIGA